jgi:hypothetical protein
MVSAASGLNAEVPVAITTAAGVQRPRLPATHDRVVEFLMQAEDPGGILPEGEELVVHSAIACRSTPGLTGLRMPDRASSW